MKIQSRFFFRLLFFFGLLVLAGQSLWASRYSNTYDPFAIPVVVTQAIDMIWDRKELGRGKLYTMSPNTARLDFAYVNFNADHPIYWVDISKGITDKHRALGFIDVAVTCYIAEIPNTNTTNWWTIRGDSDLRGGSDIRANGDGVIYELLDYRYHGRNINQVTGNSGAINLFSNSVSGRSGEYAILRMELPKRPLISYNLYLGQGIIAATGHGNTPVAPGNGNSYQVALFTGGLSNTLIPVTEIISPSTEGVYDYIYEPVNKVRSANIRHVRVPNNVPITFSAKNSYNATGSPVSKYEWDTGRGTGYLSGQDDGSYTTTYATNGDYLVSARLTAGTVVAANNAVMRLVGGIWGCAETGTPPQLGVPMGYPDYNPAATPLVLEVRDPPSDLKLLLPRPNPFVIGENEGVWVDFEVQGRTDGSSVIKVPIRVAIYALTGNLIKNLINENYPPGFWAAFWDGKNKAGNYVNEGIYYAVLESGLKKYVSKIHVFRTL